MRLKTDSKTEKIDDTNNAETSTADKSTIGAVENNSNRKKVLNILFFLFYLMIAFLTGFLLIIILIETKVKIYQLSLISQIVVIVQ